MPRSTQAIRTEAPHRCNIDPDILERLLALDEKGIAGAAIARQLKREFPTRSPHQNTVYAEIHRHAADRSGSWTLGDAEYSVDAARAVLTELAAVYRASEGRRRFFTKREAWWVARLLAIHNAGAEGFTPLEPGEAFRMARLHVQAEQRGEELSAWLDIIEPPLARLAVATRHDQQYAPKEKS